MPNPAEEAPPGADDRVDEDAEPVAPDAFLVKPVSIAALEAALAVPPAATG